jgi:hypothetical protein
MSETSSNSPGTNPLNSSQFSLQGYILGESSKAIQFGIESINGLPLDEQNIQWFPLSQTKSIYRGSGDEQDCIVVSRWIMEQKELI